MAKSRRDDENVEFARTFRQPMKCISLILHSGDVKYWQEGGKLKVAVGEGSKDTAFKSISDLGNEL